MSDARVGIVANTRNAWPDAAEIEALGAQYVRSIVYSFDDLERVLERHPHQVGIIVLLNEETDGVGNDLSGWGETLRAFARQFSGRVRAVECLNEWDLRGIPPSRAVECARVAAPLLHDVGIKCVLGSVAGPNWQNALERAVHLASRGDRVRLDGVCFHPYGQRALNFPAGYGFGEIDQVVQRAHDIAGLPVWVSEFGIKVGEAGGEPGQAEYVRRSIQALSALPADVLAAACYFCWWDPIGTPEERGLNALGLRRDDRTRSPRPAWQVYADTLGGTGAAKLVTEPSPRRRRTPRAATPAAVNHVEAAAPVNGQPFQTQPSWEDAFAQAKQDVFGAATRVGPEAQFVPGTALSDYWVLHIAELGPACGPERYGYRWDEQANDWVLQAVFQGFATGIYKWTPESGVEKAA